MLRIIRHPSAAPRPVAEPPAEHNEAAAAPPPPTHVSLKGWNIEYLFADPINDPEPNMVGTILCKCYQWDKVPLPKNPKLNTPSILPKWFKKIMNKRFNISGSDFSNSQFRINFTNTNILQKYLFNSIIFPLFDNDISEFQFIQDCSSIPDFLKIEIRQVLQNKYNSN